MLLPSILSGRKRKRAATPRLDTPISIFANWLARPPEVDHYLEVSNMHSRLRYKHWSDVHSGVRVVFSPLIRQHCRDYTWALSHDGLDVRSFGVSLDKNGTQTVAKQQRVPDRLRAMLRCTCRAFRDALDPVAVPPLRDAGTVVGMPAANLVRLCDCDYSYRTSSAHFATYAHRMCKALQLMHRAGPSPSRMDEIAAMSLAVKLADEYSYPKMLPVFAEEYRVSLDSAISAESRFLNRISFEVGGAVVSEFVEEMLRKWWVPYEKGLRALVYAVACHLHLDEELPTAACACACVVLCGAGIDPKDLCMEYRVRGHLPIAQVKQAIAKTRGLSFCERRIIV